MNGICVYNKFTLLADFYSWVKPIGQALVRQDGQRDRQTDRLGATLNAMISNIQLISLIMHAWLTFTSGSDGMKCFVESCKYAAESDNIAAASKPNFCFWSMMWSIHGDQALRMPGIFKPNWLRLSCIISMTALIARHTMSDDLLVVRPTYIVIVSWSILLTLYLYSDWWAGPTIGLGLLGIGLYTTAIWQWFTGSC